MGRLRSTTNHAGLQVAGLLLGDPLEVDGLLVWDDPALPDGQLNDGGQLTPDPAEEF